MATESAMNRCALVWRRRRLPTRAWQEFKCQKRPPGRVVGGFNFAEPNGGTVEIVRCLIGNFASRR